MSADTPILIHSLGVTISPAADCVAVATWKTAYPAIRAATTALVYLPIGVQVVIGSVTA